MAELSIPCMQVFARYRVVNFVFAYTHLFNLIMTTTLLSSVIILTSICNFKSERIDRAHELHGYLYIVIVCSLIIIFTVSTLTKKHLNWFAVYALSMATFAYAFIPLQSLLASSRLSAFLPLVVHLYSFSLFALISPMFKISCIRANGGRLLKQFSGSKYWLIFYGALFYLLPTVEFFAEQAYYPEVKKWPVWTLGVTYVLYQRIFKILFCSLIYAPVCTLYGVVYFTRSFRLLSSRYYIILQSILELLMHVIAQFLLRNPISMFFVGIALLIWKIFFPLPSAEKEENEFHRNYRHIDHYTNYDALKIIGKLNEKIIFPFMCCFKLVQELNQCISLMFTIGLQLTLAIILFSNEMNMLNFFTLDLNKNSKFSLNDFACFVLAIVCIVVIALNICLLAMKHYKFLAPAFTHFFSTFAILYSAVPIFELLTITTSLPSFLLPFVVHLNSFTFFSIFSVLFLHTWTYSQGGRQLKQFSGGKYSFLLYCTFFYLLPTIEFFVELIYCPAVKKWPVWALDLTEPSHQQFVRRFICCFVYTPICSLYWAVNLNRSFLFVNGNGYNVAQSLLELLMHIIAQFLLRNPVSMVFVVIFWLIWNVNFPLPTMDEENEKVYCAYQQMRDLIYSEFASDVVYLLKCLKGSKGTTEVTANKQIFKTKILHKNFALSKSCSLRICKQKLLFKKKSLTGKFLCLRTVRESKPINESSDSRLK